MGQSDQNQKPLFCRSRLASEKPEGAALNQAANVIVNDLREQARSYRGQHSSRPVGRCKSGTPISNTRNNGYTPQNQNLAQLLLYLL